MRYWHALFALLVAMAVAAVLTPLAARLARWIGALDKPRDRGLAIKETPRLGGLAILAAVLVAGTIWLPGGETPTRAILLGAATITAVGALDDVFDLPPWLKLLGQVGAALIAVTAGITLKEITLPFVGRLAFPNEGGLLTVFWLVGLMNVVNFSDGVDGLAAGLCAIDGIAFAVIIFDLPNVQHSYATLAAVTAGASLGFLAHNFPPARVFMGDSGANLLGYLLGIVTIGGTLKSTAVVALVVPLVILAVPFLDTGFVIAKRLKYRRKPWLADANHFHHRMARIGFSQRKTLAYLYGWTVLLAGLAVALRFVPYHDHAYPHHYHLGWLLLVVVLAVAALAASVYLVFVLEIFKFKRARMRQLQSLEPSTSEHEIDVRVRQEFETGEFERVG
ncbi:MAG: undecaprenyl/decaprenyl-phosphate alpha-N-acetylglucosaminyl 1-phosphate transferase [Solirubrobacterales bacterium]|nr:undecaprenyl/decaprenyl-phosphate alpha-N-acetylglucosaminyl 1-phosphate transferase [Solirubrobacterales bacterium]